jgi:hypothetical protein
MLLRVFGRILSSRKLSVEKYIPFGEIWFEAVVNRQPSINEKEESQATFTAKLLV